MKGPSQCCRRQVVTTNKNINYGGVSGQLNMNGFCFANFLTAFNGAINNFMSTNIGI